MAATVFRLEGVDRCVFKFESLASATQRTIMRKAVRAGGGPFLAAVRAKAPVKNRLLKRSLVLLIRAYSGSVWAIIGQEKSKSFDKARLKIKRLGGISGRGDLVPLHLVEEPTRGHTIQSSGKRKALVIPTGTGGVYRRRFRHPGTFGAHFVRAAAAQADKQSLAAFESKFIEELMKEA
jgi:hypothetical protein